MSGDLEVFLLGIGDVVVRGLFLVLGGDQCHVYGDLLTHNGLAHGRLDQTNQEVLAMREVCLEVVVPQCMGVNAVRRDDGVDLVGVQLGSGLHAWQVVGRGYAADGPVRCRSKWSLVDDAVPLGAVKAAVLAPLLGKDVVDVGLQSLVLDATERDVLDPVLRTGPYDERVNALVGGGLARLKRVKTPLLKEGLADRAWRSR